MPTTSRFRGARRYLAGWWKALHPIPAPVVNAMTPSEVAGTLGLDRVRLVVAVPMPDEVALPAEGIPTGLPPRRIRRVLEAG